ncbi:DUF2199 domain-containing protein [Priestia aryabhattai]|nr:MULTISPECIES: DUF2199 domain-containing protein [Priestia]MEB4868163.1 DUF2199 domain-containing protein [Priestia megaterium]MED3998462.1 DUF2199 domain-containing protein [Priestia aryabhattai]WDW07646.1 DUF2199 domain-containing protein [Priestia aryabhattai]
MRRRRLYGKKKTNKLHYKDLTCEHPPPALPMSYTSEAPFYYYEASEDEKQNDFELYSEICIMNQEHFFVRGCVEIPVLNEEDPFIWNIWVSLSEENFHRMINLWESDEREHEPPYFGWFSVSIPGYPETLNLKTNVHTRPVGTRPLIELEPTDHPLAIEQREGITLERIKDIQKQLATY